MRAVAFLALVNVLLVALALISCLSLEDTSKIRGMPRFLWVLAILLLPLAGPIAWFVLGRPKPEGTSRGRWPLGGGFPQPPRPKAPDDDPDFLRTIGEPGQPGSSQPTISREDEELLRRWEEDLRRREDEKRHRDTGTET